MYPTIEKEHFHIPLEIYLKKEHLKHSFKSISYDLLTRSIDLTISSCLIVPLLLVIPIVWCINLFTSPGPLFYYQNRVGVNGVVFRMPKLRTMSVNAEVNGAQWTNKQDPRITWAGNWLRKTHLDELPQIYSILIGQMSICLLYTSPSPRDLSTSRMPSSA